MTIYKTHNKKKLKKRLKTNRHNHFSTKVLGQSVKQTNKTKAEEKDNKLQHEI